MFSFVWEMAMLTLNRFLLHIRATESSYSADSQDHVEDIMMADLSSPNPSFDIPKRHGTFSSTSTSKDVLYYDNHGYPLEIDVKQESLSDGGVWEIVVEP